MSQPIPEEVASAVDRIQTKLSAGAYPTDTAADIEELLELLLGYAYRESWQQEQIGNRLMGSRLGQP
jgi:hypothetical protein